jgi:hypothetical protein
VAIFTGGIFLKFHRTHLLCTGFIGVIVASCGFIGTVVFVETQDISSFCWLLLVVVSLVALIEATMRRAMFKFLYEPQ